MIILSTGSLYTYGLDRVFALAEKAGYDGLEILVDARWDTRDPFTLKRLSSEYGMPIAALHSPFVPGIHGWPSDQLGRLEKTVALAKEVGAGVVVSHLPLRISGLEIRVMGFGNRRFLLPFPWKRRGPYYHFLNEARVQSLESSSGVMVALENMPAMHILGIKINPFWFNRSGELLRFPHLTLDTTHLGTWGLDPVQVYGTLKDRVVHVHLSNFDGLEHRSPADGLLNLSGFLGFLGAGGYKGAVSIECDPEALDAGNEQLCLEALKRALSFCRAHLSSSSLRPES
ncbi:MAG: sugar phosphate isomerase/epimerase [Deltaproteobacteria bacterium]|nr:sugar phosphate isomerase/epimerase [Deltaproteobacteria bacterium]